MWSTIMKASAIVLFLTAQALCGNCWPQMTSSPSLRSLTGTAIMNKRQSGDCSHEEAVRRINAAGCDPNYGQRIVDIYLNCNGNSNYTSDARRSVRSCSSNENGRFCYEFGAPQLFFNYTQPLRSNCPNLSSYSNYECTDLCRVALQNFKSNVGCCLSSYYNISVYDRSNFYNNPGLWSACSVSPPSFCQASTLTLSSVATRRTCSGVEVIEQIYTQANCNARLFQPILDIYKQCYSNSGLAEHFIQQCGLNENNQLCAVALYNNNSYPQAVKSECQDYNQGCTRSCYTALNTFKAALGCCLHFYKLDRDFLSTTNPALWSACGIPIPGICPSTLLPQSNSALSLEFPNITVMFVLLLLLNLNSGM